MRLAILAVTAALTFATGTLDAAPRKQPKADVGNGRITWFDITTTSMSSSKEFYGKLFGWTFIGLKGTEYAVEIVSSGKSIGTLRVAEGKLSPFDGVVYVQVADMRASCEQAKALGGTVAPGFPFNLTERTGAVGLVLDPAGHPVGMYSRTPLPTEKSADE